MVPNLICENFQLDNKYLYILIKIKKYNKLLSFI